jgi:hypothetical protein
MDEEIHPGCLECPQRVEQVREAAAEPVQRPDRDDIDLPARSVLQKATECRACRTNRRPADPVIIVDPGNLPTPLLGYGFQRKCVGFPPFAGPSIPSGKERHGLCSSSAASVTLPDYRPQAYTMAMDFV